MKEFYILMLLLVILFKADLTLSNNPTIYTELNMKSTNSSLFATEPLTTVNRDQVPCNYVRGLVVGDKERKLECCHETVIHYHNLWLAESRPLSRYLETLKGLNCPQFHRECNERLFDFNRFTGLMYDYICNNSNFFSECLPKLENITKVRPTSVSSRNYYSQNAKHNSGNSPTSAFALQWQGILDTFNPPQLTTEELLDPCVQVAQYAQSGRNETFQEVIAFGIPSCGISWCGFGAEAIRSHKISIGTCLEPSCRTRVIVIMVACGILGFAITILNVLIILILCRKPEGHKPILKNSQAIYKLSLAVADLLVGVIVLPICIVNLYTQVWTRHLPRDGLRSVEGFEVINGTISETATVVQLEFLAGSFDTKFPLSYVNFAGFFTAVSIFVSVYTLAGAGFDRLNAVAKPFTYKKRSAFNAATKACVAFWIFAFIFGILPVFIHDLRYVFVLSIVFATLELNGYILYTVSFFIPLLIVWIINFLTYYHSKKHANFRRSLTQTALKKRQKIERRLASTLRLMVGIFTFNTLPLLITFICPLFIPSILPNFPRYFNPTSSKTFLTVQFIATLLLFGNSLCNFFIYSARNREFRCTLKSLFSKFGNATKLSICLNYTNICCHDLARRGSNVSIRFSSMSFSRSRRNTEATRVSKVDMSTIHCVSPESSSIFTLSMSSRANTPNLNRQRRNRHDGVASCESIVSNITKSKGFSMTLESLNEDTVFGTPVLQPKQNGCFNSVTDHSSDSDHTKSENNIL